MITDQPDERRPRRTLAMAFLLSMLFHAVLLPLLLWLFSFSTLIRPPHGHRGEALIISSTSQKVERRPVPRPRSVPLAASHARIVRSIPRQLHVLARESANAPPQPSRTQRAPTAAQRFIQRLAQEQVAYSQEVTTLNAADNPKSIATLPPRSSASYMKSYFDESGSSDIFAGHGLLIPLKHWFDGDRSCYYVRYTFEYPNGGSEEGNVPWPICYPRNADPMQEPPHPIDLPTPMPGFRVASGTYLTPLLKFYYDHFQGKPPQGN